MAHEFNYHIMCIVHCKLDDGGISDYPHQQIKCEYGAELYGTHFSNSAVTRIKITGTLTDTLSYNCYFVDIKVDLSCKDLVDVQTNQHKKTYLIIS